MQSWWAVGPERMKDAGTRKQVNSEGCVLDGIAIKAVGENQKGRWAQ